MQTSERNQGVENSWHSAQSLRNSEPAHVCTAAAVTEMKWPAVWSTSSREDAADTSVREKTNGVTGNGTSTAPESTRFLEENTSRLRSANWRVFTDPQTLIAATFLTGTFVGFFRLYRSFLRRIPTAGNISPRFFRKRSIFGKVTSVGDGDNFRIYHTPGGLLAGWGWLAGRRIPTCKKDLKDQTIHIRIAGIDAPELAHFGRPSQPHSQEALEWLTSYILGRRVRVYVYRPDQYGRVVGTAYVWKGLWKRDVGLQMLRAGLATVYEAKTGAEFGAGLEEKYRSAEWWAKMRRKGMWAGRKEDYESPRAYKTRHAAQAGQAQQPKV